MTVVGVSMVKDEADVIDGVIRHMADEVDHLLVADNGSTDGTREILDELARDLPLTVVDDPDPAYYQAVKVTALANRAYAELGAVWIVPFDADELWYATDRVSTVLRSVPTTFTYATATLWNHYPTSIDEWDISPFKAMTWRSPTPGALPKVAIRWQAGASVSQGNHGCGHPHGLNLAPHALALRHFPYRSETQFISKARNGAAAYKLTDLPADQGNHWRAYGEILDRHGPQALADVYREHFYYLSPTDSGLVHDPAPFLRWRTEAAPAVGVSDHNDGG